MFDLLRLRLEKIRDYRHNATLTRARFEAKRLQKFREFAGFAQQSSPYYAAIMRERNIEPATATPEQFPVLTKAALMANFDAIVTDKRVTKAAIADFLTRSKEPTERFLDHYTVIHTSGSSGEVGYFVYAPADIARGVGMGRKGQRPKPSTPRRNRGRYRVAFFGATDGHYAGVTMVSQLRRGLTRLLLKTALFEVNSPLPDVIAGLNAFQPDMLLGYTTALKILAEKQREGVLQIAPIFITASGEATTRGDKEILEQAFGCGVMNAYGCSEHLGMGGALPGSEKLVLYDDDLIFECREDHTLVTNLFNRTLPLIRYRMADTLKPVMTDAHRPYLVVENLIGRNELQPVFVNRDGVKDFISPHTINEIFVRGVTRFQLHLTGEAAFRFLVCIDRTLAAAERESARNGVEKRLREILAAKRLDNVQFSVEEVDDLPVNPRTRKFQLIVDARAAG
jgi:phenylacetate-coenzyme A ligase PaaK-like adenylate-forming protein